MSCHCLRSSSRQTKEKEIRGKGSDLTFACTADVTSDNASKQWKEKQEPLHSDSTINLLQLFWYTHTIKMSERGWTVVNTKQKKVESSKKRKERKQKENAIAEASRKKFESELLQKSYSGFVEKTEAPKKQQKPKRAFLPHADDTVSETMFSAFSAVEERKMMNKKALKQLEEGEAAQPKKKKKKQKKVTAKSACDSVSSCPVTVIPNTEVSIQHHSGMYLLCRHRLTKFLVDTLIIMSIKSNRLRRSLRNGLEKPRSAPLPRLLRGGAAPRDRRLPGAARPLARAGP